MSELDSAYDAVMQKLTGEGGMITLADDALGNKIVTSFPATLPAFFAQFTAMYGDTDAVVAGDERLSFRQLDQLSTRIAHGLVRRGICKGDRVAIAMRNCPAYILAYMAAAKAGAIVTLLNGWWQVEELAHALNLSEPALVLADEPRAHRIAATRIGTPVEVLAIELPAEQCFAAFLGDDDATILFTSGSTGDSKGAVSTHRAVTSAVYTYGTSLMVLKQLMIAGGKTPPDQPRTLLNVPLFHVTGSVPVMLNSFVIGRAMIVMAKWDPVEAMRLIEKEKISYFVGVPTMSLELMLHPDRDKYDLSSLTDIAGGGAHRPVAHVERLKQAFPGSQPAQGYGLTETNAVGAGNFWTNYAAKPASTGRPQRPLVEMCILGPDDRHLPPGEVGEIGIKTAANIRGYWKNEEATRAAFTTDGWLRTGDVGYLDEENYLFIVDRKKDIIIRGGENISCADVEAAIYSCDGVAETAVVAAPDERLGEVPVAFVHVTEGKSVDEATLRAHLEPRLAAFKIPARIIFSDTPLPRLGTGKIDRVQIKQRLAAA